MPAIKHLWMIKSGHNPNSYNFLRKLMTHKNMNCGKANEDIVSVRTLLDACPYIPEYATVMESDRAVKKRIIEPFERDMNALKKTLTWCYCHSGGTPFSSKEVSVMNYPMFVNALIKTTWVNYPDQAERREKQKKAAAKPSDVIHEAHG